MLKDVKTIGEKIEESVSHIKNPLKYRINLYIQTSRFVDAYCKDALIRELNFSLNNLEKIKDYLHVYTNNYMIYDYMIKKGVKCEMFRHPSKNYEKIWWHHSPYGILSYIGRKIYWKSIAKEIVKMGGDYYWWLSNPKLHLTYDDYVKEQKYECMGNFLEKWMPTMSMIYQTLALSDEEERIITGG